ncbi:MAG: four helix bundle protein [Terriglobales bacterium]
MNPAKQLENRAKQFAIRIIRLSRALPKTPEAGVIRNQLLRSATSVEANYRAACRSRSDAEFLSRLAVVLEEADETVYWLELLVEVGVIPSKRLQPLIQEADELLRIFSAGRHTTQTHIRNRKSEIGNRQSAGADLA